MGQLCQKLFRRPLFIFSVENRFRQTCQAVVSSKLFDRIVIAAIIASSFTLGLEFCSMTETFQNVLWWLDLLFNIFFTFEVAVKVVDIGLLLGRGTYVRNSWNVLDLSIVSLSWLTIASGGTGVGKSLKAFRVARALRPLRAITHLPRLKAVVSALFMSLKAIANVLVVTLIVWLIFAIGGVQLWMGTFWRC